MESVNNSLFMNCTNDNCTINGADDFTLAPSLPLLVRILQSIIYVIELILGTTLNASLILLILFRKPLHQRGFAATVLILFTNIGFAVPLFSTSAYIAPGGEWILGDSFCHFIAFNGHMFQTQRWLLTSVLVVDRALTINRPLKYEKHGAKIVFILSTGALILGFLSAIALPTVLQSCIGFVPGFSSCHFQNIDASQVCGLYVSSSATILILLGGVLPFVLYIWMFCKAKKVQTQVVPISTQPTASSHLSVSRKQVLTIFIFYWTLLGCSVPYYFSFLILLLSLQVNSLNGLIAGYHLLIITQPIFYGLVIADPIAIMWNKDVKQEVNKIKHKVEVYLSTHFTNTLPPPVSTNH